VLAASSNSENIILPISLSTSGTLGQCVPAALSSSENIILPVSLSTRGPLGQSVLAASSTSPSSTSENIILPFSLSTNYPLGQCVPAASSASENIILPISLVPVVLWGVGLRQQPPLLLRTSSCRRGQGAPCCPFLTNEYDSSLLYDSG
jgi:hypothetical protein